MKKRTQKQREREARWYVENKEKVREYNRKYRAANKDRLRERRAKQYASSAATSARARDRAAKWAAANKDRVRDIHSNWLARHLEGKRTTVRGAAKAMHVRAKSRAACAGYSCDLTLDWFEAELSKQIAAGVIRLGPKSPWSPSLDQQTPGLGYVTGNVSVLPLWMNFAKHTFSEADLKEAIKAWVVANP